MQKLRCVSVYLCVTFSRLNHSIKNNFWDTSDCTDRWDFGEGDFATFYSDRSILGTDRRLRKTRSYFGISTKLKIEDPEKEMTQKKKEELAPCTGNGTGRIHGFKFVVPWSLSGITSAGRYNIKSTR